MEYCGRKHEKAELTMGIGARIKGKPVRLGKLPGEWKLEGPSKWQGGGSGPEVRQGQGLPSGWGYRGQGKEQS